MEDAFEGARVPEIWETEEDNGFSIGQLKYKYLQFAKRNFQGKVFTNEKTGKPIRVSADGLMEWHRKSRRREHILAVQSLDFFLQNAIFIEDSPDYKNRPEIESASRFESECKINNRLYKVVITTRKGVEDIDKFRYFSLKDIATMPK